MAHALLQQMRKLFAAPEPAIAPVNDLHAAVGVLLVEAARMDDQFAEAERGMIAGFLSEKFGLSAEDRRTVLDESEAAAIRSAQLHPFTRAAFTRLAPPERIRLIEMLWEVAYSDGVLTPEEDALVRRIAGLIYVSDEDRVAARRRVASRYGVGQS